MRLVPAVCALVLGAFALEAAVRGVSSYDVAEEEFPATPWLAAIDPRYVSLLTFGHRSLFEDLLYISVLHQFNDARMIQVAPERVVRMVDAVLRHRPRIESFYIASCFVLAEDVLFPEACPHILEHGAEVFPSSWQIRAVGGWVYAAKLKRLPEAGREFAAVAAHPDAPAWAPGVAAALEQGGNLSMAELESVTTLHGLLTLIRGRQTDGRRRPPDPPEPDGKDTP